MPQNEATYIHRVGRTARAGHAGRAVTFVEEDRRLLMKEFVRRAVAAKQQIKTRVINKAVGRIVEQNDKQSIDKLNEKIEGFKPVIDEIYEEEVGIGMKKVMKQRTEKELELATMEATRANNLVKYEDEIKSRRKRTWFKSEKEKKQVRSKEFEKKRMRTA